MRVLPMTGKPLWNVGIDFNTGLGSAEWNDGRARPSFELPEYVLHGYQQLLSGLLENVYLLALGAQTMVRPSSIRR
ncbi:hypothetical protein GCM10027280_50030 [Micromonospora polyrhachis]